MIEIILIFSIISFLGVLILAILTFKIFKILNEQNNFEKYNLICNAVHNLAKLKEHDTKIKELEKLYKVEPKDDTIYIGDFVLKKP